MLQKKKSTISCPVSQPQGSGCFRGSGLSPRSAKLQLGGGGERRDTAVVASEHFPKRKILLLGRLLSFFGWSERWVNASLPALPLQPPGPRRRGPPRAAWRNPRLRTAPSAPSRGKRREKARVDGRN